jgi:hypothetical protein
MKTHIVIRFAPYLFFSLLFLACGGDGCGGTDSNVPPCPTSGENPSSLGIFSETGSTLQPDVNSFIGKFQGNGGQIELVTDANEKKEGSVSLKATLSVSASSGGYAGWFVSWGNLDLAEENSCTRNMSTYGGGSIVFWVKSTINLEVGVRSGNVQAGEESSKVLLSNFQSFAPDTTWRRVCIPLSLFQGAAPKADLSKIKVFFVIASNTPSGGTGGVLQSFWIDDVRWETNSCP